MAEAKRGRILRVGLSAAAQDASALIRVLPEGAIVVWQELTSPLLDAASQQQLVEANPDLVVIESTQGEVLLRRINQVHRVLPNAWLLAVSSAQDPDLIIRCVRAGAREFLPIPLTAEAMATAAERFLGEHPERLRQPGMVVGVTSAKGGTGSTSVAINLAAALAKLEGTRVALADLTYPLGDVAAYLGLHPKYALSDALQAATRIDPVLLETFMSQKAEMHVLAGLAQFGPWPGEVVRGMARLLDVLSEAYSHAVLDLSGAVSEEFIGVVADRSQQLLVVLTAEIPAVWRTHRLLDYLAANGWGDKVRLVLNRGQKSAEISRADIEKALEQRLYWELPNDYRATIDSINNGLPVVQLEGAALAKSYFALAERISGLSRGKKKGLFGLFG